MFHCSICSTLASHSTSDGYLAPKRFVGCDHKYWGDSDFNPTADPNPRLERVKVGNETWTALGGLNGGEVSHKVNREVVLLVDAPALYDRLREVLVFLHDWTFTTRCKTKDRVFA